MTDIIIAIAGFILIALVAVALNRIDKGGQR